MTNSLSAEKRSALLFSCSTCFAGLLFIYIALMATSNYSSMFDDSDALWHIAAGDWIRTHGYLPAHDPWSFTAGDTRWLNISWLWDVVFSWIHETLGWHGAVAINAIILALVFVLLYLLCFVRTGQHAVSIITVMNAVALFPLSLRPLQISNILLIIWCWLIGEIYRGKIAARWLCILPLSMLLWVNMHGGFILGCAVLLLYFISAVREKKTTLARHLFFTGEIIFLAILCNPYGLSIFEAVWRTIGTPAQMIIQEWHPFVTSSENLIIFCYIGIFLWLVPRRPLAIPPAERWLAYLWLWLGLTSARNLTIFAIFSAPLVAMSIAGIFAPIHAQPDMQRLSARITRISSHRSIVSFIVMLCSALTLWLPSGNAEKLFGHTQLSPTNLDSEIRFLMENHPKARLLITFDLSSTVLYQTRGAIPVFIDPRVDTAYPRQVISDYIDFSNNYEKTDEILRRYNINGIMLPNNWPELYARFEHRKGWKLEFQGPTAAIFLRQGP